MELYLCVLSHFGIILFCRVDLEVLEEMKREDEKQLHKDEKKEKPKTKRQKSKIGKAQVKSKEAFDKEDSKEQKSIVKGIKEKSTETLECTKESKDVEEVKRNEDINNGKGKSQLKTVTKSSEETKKPDKVSPVKKKRLIFSFRRSKPTAVSSPSKDKLHAKSPSVEESAM